MSESVITEYRMEINVTLLILFGFASFIGMLGVMTNNNPTGFWSIFLDLITTFGNWVFWMALAGLLGLIFSVWWAFDFIFKIRKLKDLIDTESKAKFLKNQDEIEYIAWRLPKKYKMSVAKKKADLRI